MSGPVAFRVAGVPGAQGSMRAFAHGGRAHITQGGSKASREKLASWRTLVAAEAAVAMGDRQPFTDGVYVSLHFLLPRPASETPGPRSKRVRRMWVAKAPDVDKLIRGTFDAMTGVVFADDRQVVAVLATKSYADGQTGAQIVVSEACEADWPVPTVAPFYAAGVVA